MYATSVTCREHIIILTNGRRRSACRMGPKTRRAICGDRSKGGLTARACFAAALWRVVAHHPPRAVRGNSCEWRILPEPNLPDSKRWCTVGGSEHYPYVRFLGGISLFDFDRFDPDAYSEKCPSSCWAYFVPYHSEWECAVWIEIDRGKVTPPHFVSGIELLAKWKADGAFGHNIMPEIEAAYLGFLPRAAFRRAFLVRKKNSELLDLLVEAS